MQDEINDEIQENMKSENLVGKLEDLSVLEEEYKQNIQFLPKIKTSEWKIPPYAKNEKRWKLLLSWLVVFII